MYNNKEYGDRFKRIIKYSGVLTKTTVTVETLNLLHKIVCFSSDLKPYNTYICFELDLVFEY